MTQHWNDIANADVIMVIGSNIAENHPMGMKHVQKAIDKGATLIHVDPRFTRTSAKAHLYAPLRSGTDIAFIGGMIKYAIDNGKYNEKYLRECTNALFKVRTDFLTCPQNAGVFSGLDTAAPANYNATLQSWVDAKYSKTTWNYQDTGATNPVVPLLATDFTDPDCVFQKLKMQFDEYSVDNVCAITGVCESTYLQICEAFCESRFDDKSGTICYALGTTQHTHGVQNIRAYSILQMLMGNLGVAGGGVNAMRGQDNVQGATDQAVLFNYLPGYLRTPHIGDTDIASYCLTFHDPTLRIEPTSSYTVRGVAGKDPTSDYWWKNANKYIASLAKAWWPTVDHNVAFDYFPKKAASGTDYSLLSLIHDGIYNGVIKGLYTEGVNLPVSDTDQNFERGALKNLEWLVCTDIFETELSAFWRLDPAGTNTTVYLLPAASTIEQYGQRINSGRWAQWHWKGGNPPGEAKPNTEIITILGQKIQALYAGSALPQDNPIKLLNWPCFDYVAGEESADQLGFAEKVSKELNGYWLNPDGTVNKTKVFGTLTNTSGLVAGFAALMADGTTACGNWLYCNSFVDPIDFDTFEKTHPGIWAATPGNRMARRYSADVPNGGPSADPLYKNIGLHYYFSWCWPYNRRIVYNRAATYQSDGNAYLSDGSTPAVLAGDPLAPDKYVIRWVPTDPLVPLVGSWKGDMADRTAAVGDIYPFIMTKDGHGHLFGGWTVAEGPFPWHYEPVESPVNQLLGTYRVNPTIHIYPGVATRFAQHGDDTYNIVCTTYRFTEHYHSIMTREMPRLNELQPEPIVEISEELAADTTGTLVINSDTKGPIANGDLVTLTSIRGTIQLKACVTKRFAPFKMNGKVVHEVGLQWTWGFMALNPGPSANMLTPFVGDPNTRIMEYKAFRINIEKV